MSDNNWLNTSSGSEIVGSRITKSAMQSNGNAENRFDDLLIFGYACKIFRDDEKARFIDQGKHLIPWMGDDSLKIDRLIHSLAQYLSFSIPET